MTLPPDLAALFAPLLAADHPPRAWQGACQLPWDDPDFSERMLAVHLDPSTHMASRSPDVIRRHCDWLEARLGPGRHRILDVGCGPGLYCHELARRGHATLGFDFAPASLAWAGERAREEGLDCVFFPADLRALPADLAERTGPVDAVTFWFGEFHSFPPPVAEAFLRRLVACLRIGGALVLEYQPWEIFVREDAASWSVAAHSPFRDGDHLWLQEFAWDEEAATEVHVHWIIDPGSATLARYVQCHQAWSDDDLVALLARCGLGKPEFHEPVTGVSAEFEFPLLVAAREARGRT
jgi:SAM-dependent methyltransferase